MTDSLTLKDPSTGRCININTTVGEYWLDSIDWGTVGSSNHTFKYLDQIGVYLYNTTLETRQITIVGWAADNDVNRVRELRRSLNSMINPQRPLEAIRGQYKISFVPVTSVKYSPTLKDNNEYMAKFLITGFCPYPLFTDLESQRVSIAYTERRFRFPLSIPRPDGLTLGLRQPSLIGEVDNPGDIPLGYTIEFRALGTVVNPKLIDIGSQEFIHINKTLSSGESVWVYTREGERKVRGGLDGNDSNYFQYLTYDSSWLSLAQGNNLLRYDAEEGITDLEVIIHFDPGYLEVEE